MSLSTRHDALNQTATNNRRPREALQNYYGLSSDSKVSEEKNSKFNENSGPCDINGPLFDPDIYLNKILKELTLQDLMDKEQEMTKHIRTLDSDMQTLVYENYNKFISATDTIRKMKTDFKKMEEEMDCLAKNMSVITKFSGNISTVLQDRREQITKLSGVHTLLKKLQFLFELPTTLQKCIQNKKYTQAVRFHIKARKVLHQYQHMASFQGIQHDCQIIVQQLTEELRSQFRSVENNPKQLAESVELLLQLNEPAEKLCDEFLAHAEMKIQEDLKKLELQIKLNEGIGFRLNDNKLSLKNNEPNIPSSSEYGLKTNESMFSTSKSSLNQQSSFEKGDNITAAMDVLAFIDCGCNDFLSNVCLVVSSYNDMFLNRQQENFFLDPLDLYRVPSFSAQLDAIALKKLVIFVNGLMGKYFDLVQQRAQMENSTGDNTLLVRALDRFHRRLQAMNKLIPDSDYSRAGTEIVSKTARDRVAYYFVSLNRYFADCLTNARETLASNRSIVTSSAANSLLSSNNMNSSSIKTESRDKTGNMGGGLLVGGGSYGCPNLGDVVRRLHSSLVDQVKSVLFNLQAFIDSDITFAMKPYFRNNFCLNDVREKLVVAFIRSIITTALDFIKQSEEKSTILSSMLLIMSRLCLDLEQSTIVYLLTVVEEQFQYDDHHSTTITQSTILCSEARQAAQKLLDQYVKVQGSFVSQMLRKSIETRDCLSAIEPRNVRVAMKRVIEDITSMDLQVGQLFEEGPKTERTSDSTRRSTSYVLSNTMNRQQGAKSTWSFTPSTMDNSLMNNIQKLFHEKIELFTPAEFNKISVLTGIIKISLKTFLECVRMRTFGRYGLQQIQVDCQYLQLYLWRFVLDENLVHLLLGEILSSTILRCLDPVTMETSVVDLICERG